MKEQKKRRKGGIKNEKGKQLQDLEPQIDGKTE